MAIKLTTTSQELLDKKFKAVPRGYDPLAVDQYLDKIIRDYRVIEANNLVERKDIEELEAKIKELENKNKALEIENAKYSKRLDDIKNNKNVTVENIDLMKRIAAYEKYIFKTGVNPKTIK